VSVRRSGTGPAVSGNSENSGSRAIGGKAYRIVPGDTLSAIALAAYGHASWWPAIKEMNAKKVGKNELILAGDSIQLPSAAEAKAIIAKLAGQKKTDQASRWEQAPPTGKPATGGVAPTAAAAAPADAQVVPVAAPAQTPEPASSLMPDAPDVRTGLVKLSAGSTPRKVIAEAFGIRPEEVNSIHTQALAESNPKFDLTKLDEPFPADTLIQLAGTPQLLRLQRAVALEQRMGLRQVLAEDVNAAPGTEQKLSDEARASVLADQKTLEAHLKKIERTLERKDLMAQFAVMTLRGEKENAPEKIKEAYSPWVARAGSEQPELARMFASSQFEAHRAAVGRTLGKDQATSVANIAAAKALLGPMIEAEKDPMARAELVRGRAQLSGTEAAIQSNAKVFTTNKTPSIVDEEHPLSAPNAAAVKEAQTAIATLTTSAETDLKDVITVIKAKLAGPALKPEEKKHLEETLHEVQKQHDELPITALQANAAVHAAVNDSPSLMKSIEAELKLRMGLDQSVELLKPTLEGKIDASEKSAWFFGTTVHSLSPTQLKTITEKLGSLPEAQREAALEVVTRYAQTAAQTKTHSGVTVASQILTEAAKANPKWGLEATLAQAGQAAVVGAVARAEELYESVRKATLVGEETRKGLELSKRALQGQVESYGRMAREGSNEEKQGAAIKLSELRQALEASTGQAPTKVRKETLEPDVLASLNISEIEALLASGQGQKADAALEHLKATYAQLPVVKTTVERMEKEYRQSGAAAFLKVLGTESMTNITGAEMAWYAGGGAALGTIATFGAGGSVIPVGGTLVGAVVGGVVSGAMWALGALSIKAVAGSWSHASEAYSTRLTSMGTTEAALGIAGTVGGLIGLGAPFGMLTKLGGRAGLQAALVGAKAGPEAAALLEARMAKLAATPELVAKGFNALSHEEKLRQTQVLWSHEAIQAGLMVGAKAQGTVMGAQLGNLARQWILDIEMAEMPEEEKIRQRGMMWQQLATIGIQVVAVGGIIGGGTWGLYRGTPPQIRAALQARATRPNVHFRELKLGEEHTFSFTGEPKDIFIDPKKRVASVERTEEGAIISGDKIGKTTIKLKGVGERGGTAKVEVVVMPSDEAIAASGRLATFYEYFLKPPTQGAGAGYEKLFADPAQFLLSAKAHLPELQAHLAAAVDDSLPGLLSRKQWLDLQTRVEAKIALAEKVS